MLKRSYRLSLIAGFVALGALAGACKSGSGVAGVLTGTGKVDPQSVKLPSQILGLIVTPEDVSTRLEVERPYVDTAGLFALRENDLMRASLQVSRFNRLARPKDAKFRSSVIALMGKTVPVELTVGDTQVYSVGGNEQNLFAWFDGNVFFLLSVHQDFEFPRTLLRRVINLDLKV